MKGIQKRAFVTGATGFIGLNLIEALSIQGWEITAFHRQQSQLDCLQSFPVRLEKGTLEDKASIFLAMPIEVDAVFHVAGDVTMWTGNSARQSRTNVDGTRNIIEVALEKGAKKLVHTSSSIVYGFSNRGFDETAPQVIVPACNYAASKILAEAEVRKGIKLGLNAVILNPAHVIGRYDRHNWSRLFMLAAAGRLPFNFPGRGSFCSGSAVAQAHISAVNKGRNGENYILAGADSTYREVLEIICQLLGRDRISWTAPAAFIQRSAQLLDLLSILTEREPLITREAAALLTADTSCRSSKAIQELDYRVVSLRNMLDDCYKWIVAQRLIP